MTQMQLIAADMPKSASASICLICVICVLFRTLHLTYLSPENNPQGEILWYHAAMQFLQPLFLLALFAVPLIALLHILRERRKRVAVPSLLLWRNIPRKPEGKRLNRLPLTWLLLLHLLIALLLALGLGQPQVLTLFGAPRHTILIVDTSTSMAADAGGETRIEAAHDEAQTLVRRLNGADRLTLIAMGPQARLLDAGTSADSVRLAQTVATLEAGGTGSNLPEALTLAQAAIRSDLETQIVILSDSALPPQPSVLTQRPVAAPIEWREVGGSVENRAIVAFAARPWPGGKRTQLYARIANFSDRAEQVTLRLFADGQPLDSRTVALDANGQSDQSWTLSLTSGTIEARIDGNDALAADDSATVRLTPRRTISALLVSDEPTTLERALQALPELELRTVSPAAYAPSAVDVTIFDGVIAPETLPAGGVLLIAPPPGSPQLEVRGQGLLAEPLLRANSPLLNGLNLGGVDFGPISYLTPPPWADITLASSGTPLILRGRSDTSEVAVWAFGVRTGNLRTRLAFPLLIARTVRDLSPAVLPSSVQAGGALEVSPSSRANLVELIGPDGNRVSKPSAPLLTFDQFALPGIYTLREQGDAGLLYEGYVAVNVGAAAESDLRPGPRPEIPVSPPPAVAISDAAGGRDLWPWLAVLALVTLLIEWIYVHYRPVRKQKARST